MSCANTLFRFTVLNMLIGVLCEVVSAVDAKSKEDILIDYVRETLLKTLTKIDEESRDSISQTSPAIFAGAVYVFPKDDNLGQLMSTVCVWRGCEGG